MEILTAGFTKWAARDFFGTLEAEQVERLVDVRLQNTSQLAGFAKRDDLEYFLRELLGIQYVHEPRLAPSPELFDDYKKKRIGWTDFEERFEHLMRERKIAQQLTPDDLAGGTFTLTNAGQYGTMMQFPIINQPQVAILSTDGVKRKPVVVTDEFGNESIAIHSVGVLAMAWDHRAFDGAYAAAFLNRIQEIIETRDWEAEIR